MQQGRVALDADHNEQTAIDVHYQRTVARDVIGPYAAPAGTTGGFVLATDASGVFAISKGVYYVDGILVENDTDNCTYKTQPDFPVPADDALLAALAGNANAGASLSFWVYLDVWERHITPIEDDSIREKALGGPDTCTRAKVVWQIKALPLTADLRQKLAAAEQKVTAQINTLWTQKAQLEKQFQAAAATDTTTQINLLKQLQPVDDQLARLTRLSLLPVHETLLSQLVRISNASLAARVDPGMKAEDACVTPPDSKYRGAENQLYRVEIHRGGTVGTATFKWSRDNGSIATVWLGGEGSDLQVANARGFAAGNWVELSDDTSELLGKPGTLVQLVKVEGDTLSVDPTTTLPPISNFPVNPKVRRWDHVATDAVSLADDNAVPIQESPAGATPDQIVWMDLEDGVQIQFSAAGEYRTGDYWLIPARVATGNVEWPQADDLNPQPLPPHGIEHHYALLGAVIRLQENIVVENIRCEFWPLFFCAVQTAIQAGTNVIRPGLLLTKSVSGARPAAPTKPSRKKSGLRQKRLRRQVK
jgi:hypothetical protein